jgi:hypothetical protein
MRRYLWALATAPLWWLLDRLTRDFPYGPEVKPEERRP